MGLSARTTGSSSAKMTGTAGVGAGAGIRQSGPGEKCNSTAPSTGNRESANAKRHILADYHYIASILKTLLAYIGSWPRKSCVLVGGRYVRNANIDAVSRRTMRFTEN